MKLYRYPQKVMRRVGTYLGEPGRLRRGDREAVARVLGVSARTLRSWRRSAGAQPASWGRPSHPKDERKKALWAVARELRRQGKGAGWRPVSAALGDIPVRLVQEMVGCLKARRRKRRDEIRRASRVRVEVLFRDVIWGQDATHLGGKAWAEVIRDRGSLRTVGIQEGKPVQAQDVIRLLEQTGSERGIPLVWATDNGPAYRSQAVREYLERRQIVPLLSLPRTPQHNGATERGIGELKAEAGIGAGVPPAGAPRSHAQLVEAACRLDCARLRGSKGFRSAIMLDNVLGSGDTFVERSIFYNRVREAIRQATLGSLTARQRRMREREAIFRTLEGCGLIRRTRGGAPYAPGKAEVFS